MPESVTVPVPFCCTAPVPLMLLVTFKAASLRLNARATPLWATGPLPRLPALPPLPTCTVPPEMVVPPA